MKKKVAVLGSGTMGHGIAEAFALGGHQVNIFDIDIKVLEKAKEKIKMELEVLYEEDYIEFDDIQRVLDNLTLYTDLKSAVEDRDYVIEAIPEVLTLKQDTFQKLDEWCPEHTILASNTSSLKLLDMIGKVSEERKSRCAINHWFNPAHIIPVVELSDFGNISEEVYKEIYDMYVALGKKPAKVLKDVPGLLANRLQQAIMREVFSLMEKEIAHAEDIDNVLKFGPGFRYPLAGPLEIVDFGGADIWYIEAANLLPDMDNSTEPNKFLKEKMDKGELGLKTGKGFYDYTNLDTQEIIKQYNKKLIQQLKVSKKY